VIAWSGMPLASAQLPNCQAPRSNEPLLLVVTRTPEAQSRLRSVISRDAELSVCSYFGETVTRVGGYKDQETAKSWANYLNDTVRLRAFVALPQNGQVAAKPPELQVERQSELSIERPQPSLSQPTTAMISPTPSVGYSPRPLGEGFAVIVNHYNRPEVAIRMQQALDRNVGLVSFAQRPYLLAVHTRDRAVADSIMRSLNDLGFAAMLVSSRRLTLLTPAVRTDTGVGGQY
jgi:hypothetical protein